MPKTVYGGPYVHETDAITAESLKEKPDYDALIADWETISDGAERYIVQLSEPVELPVGDFIQNVVFDEAEEAEIPEVTLYTTPDDVPDEIDDLDAIIASEPLTEEEEVTE